jgi:endoglucanase
MKRILLALSRTWFARTRTRVGLWCLLAMSCIGSAQAGCLATQTSKRAEYQLKGVNLAGAEFASKKLPGVLGTDYAYPSRAELAYFKSAGMQIIRLPMRWERVQRTLLGPLDVAEVAQIARVLGWAQELDLCVLLDLHNYGNYAAQPIGSPQVSVAAFEDVWLRLASTFADTNTTALGLMNEPAALQPSAWVAIAQSTLLALRRAGAEHLLLVGSGRWSGAHEFDKPFDGVSAAQSFAQFKDPLNRFAVELHQYADKNFSGTSADCIAPERLTNSMQHLARWSRTHRVRFFMGEFGVASSAACLEALRALLEPMQDTTVWLGWTYWAAGARWGKYPFSIHPTATGTPPAQMVVLRDYLSPP